MFNEQSIIERHKFFIGLNFTPKVSLKNFTKEEKDILNRYGQWFNALMKETIEPYTPGQHQFVAVCKGNKIPETKYEEVWHKYQQTIKDNEKYLIEREKYYNSLIDEELIKIWEKREDIDIETDELLLLRVIIRDRKGISNRPTINPRVCRSCGMVENNCTCERNWF